MVEPFIAWRILCSNRDSDFAYLCCKLRERGATVPIMGEAKSPDALRNASDQFFEWVTEPALAEPPKPAAKAEAARPHDPNKPVPKLRPRYRRSFMLLAADAPEGKVSVGCQGLYLKRADPSFSPKNYEHSGLLDMLKAHDLLKMQQESGGHWTVRLPLQRAERVIPSPSPCDRGRSPMNWRTPDTTFTP